MQLYLHDFVLMTQISISGHHPTKTVASGTS